METQLRRGGYVPSEKKIAELLGLTLEEYGQLSHSGLRAVRGMNDEIVKYYMVISPLNPESILKKLQMNKLRMIYFPPEAFDYKDMPMDEAV